jgi:hypothetical protein
MPANYVLLEKITVGAAGASSVTFSGIPQTGYTDLVVKASARGTRAQTETEIRLTVNGSATSYSNRALQGNGSSAASFTYSTTFFYNGETDAASATASTFGNAEIYIPNYTSSNFKSISTDAVSENNATGGAYINMVAGLWSNTSPITSMTLTPGANDWAQGSTFYLYGVAKLGTTPAIVPYATGGDTIMTDGTYWYHAFRSSGTFTPAKGLSCDVLVVAGGGGGGGTAGGASPAGGGGAGGIFYATAQGISSAQTVTIGAGGATSTAGSSVNGNAGNNTTFGSLTAAVGGGFGAGSTNGGSGGSGGGARNGGTGGSSTQTGTGGTGYGFAGGNTVGNFASAGGGGASVIGTSGENIGVNSAGGAGGAGLNTWSTWLNTTGTGVSGFIAGGGGGGSYQAAGGTGGSGGGGAGASTSGVAGTANTGGGGGGSGSNGSSNTGGAGGSGLVVVRYLV